MSFSYDGFSVAISFLENYIRVEFSETSLLYFIGQPDVQKSKHSRDTLDWDVGWEEKIWVGNVVWTISSVRIIGILRIGITSMTLWTIFFSESQSFNSLSTEASLILRSLEV